VRAVSFQRFGGPEVLELVELPDPTPGPGQVQVRVKAAGINPIDFKIRSGSLREVFPTTLPAVPGVELAGVVEELGEGVEGVAPGDEVLGWAQGGAYAERSLASEFAIKPPQMSWQEAGALPVAGETAARALDLLGLGAGETIVVHGAAGAVGTLAVQLAVARGAIVIGTAGLANHDYLRSLGATPLLYGEGLVERVREIAPDGVDAAFDVAGQGALRDSIELTGGPERVLTIADPQAAAELGVRYSGGRVEGMSERLAGVLALYEQGAVRLTIARAFPLEQAAEAQRASEAGHARGKLVLVPG
jgi:NADPH:quinone reductase-like Zn-dependent oxidoreductase